MARQEDPCSLDYTVLDRGQGEKFRGTGGDDHLAGTNGADTFNIRQGGDDHVDAGRGHDTIYMGATLTADDRINGGGGVDTLVLDGDYSKGLTFQPNTISGIEDIKLEGASDYSLTLADRHVGHGGFTVDASGAQSLSIDASAVTVGLNIIGSSGDDVIIGASISNGIEPGGGHDVMTGGSGGTHYAFVALSDSVPSAPDEITNFHDSSDEINVGLIDANPSKKGEQPFHLGATPHHVGDITLTYDSAHDVTDVNFFTHDSTEPDMVIQLDGDHTDLTAANFPGVTSATAPVDHLAISIYPTLYEHHLPIS